MTEQWQELKETIIEMRDNDGTDTQQEACKFLVNLMNVLEKQMQEPKTGYWILLDECSNSGYYCSECHKKVVKEGWSNTVKKIKYCPNCGARMVEPQEGARNDL